MWKTKTAIVNHKHVFLYWIWTTKDSNFEKHKMLWLLPISLCWLTSTRAGGMFLYFVVFVVLFMPVTPQSVKMRSFLATRSCDDRISSIELVAEYQVHSRRSCAAMCGINCGCFGFNSLGKKCRIHHSCDLVNMTLTENGWRYYLIDRKNFIKYGPNF